MATIRIKRGSTTPAYTSLAQGEPAVNTTLNTLFIRTGTAGNSADVKLIGAEIEAQTAANGFSAINWGSASDSKLATQTAIETRFMPKAGGTFTGAVSFGQGSTAAGEIRLLEDTDDGSNYSAFRGSARAANITYVMPTTDPTAGQVLSAGAPSTNVSTLSWVDAGAASTVTVTNDDTTTTLYPIFSTATSGSVSPKIDSDGMTYDAAADQLNGVNIKASNLLILGDSTDFEAQDFSANAIISGTFSTSTVNFIPVTSDFTNYNFVVASGGTENPTINFGTGDLVSSTKTINIGTGGGSSTTTAINIGSTAGTSTTTVNNNLTVTGDVAVNGGDITTSSTGTVTVFNTNATTVNLGGAATTMAIGNTATAAQTVNMFTASTGASTYNFATGATASATTKTVNLGTGGAASSTTNVNLGSNNGGTFTVNSPTTMIGTSSAASIDAVSGASTGVFETPTTISFAGKATSLSIGNTASTAQTVNMFTASTGASTYNFATGATGAATTKTLNIGTGGAASSTTAINIGANSSGAVNLVFGGGAAGTTTFQCGTLVGTASVQALFNTTAVTVNAFGAASAITMGDSTAATTTIRGGTLVGNTTTQNVFNTTATTVNAFGAATTVTIGSSTATINLGGGSTGATVNVKGNLVVEGTTTTINSTTLTVDDKNIEMGSVTTPTNTTADGGGITLAGGVDGNKTIIWDSTNANWTSSEHWNIASTKVYKINNTQVLSASALGSGVTTSSLTTVGALSSGSITTGFTQITAANMVGLAALDIDGGTATTTIVGSDLLIVDDGANGTNRYVTVDNLFGSSSTATIDGGTYP